MSIFHKMNQQLIERQKYVYWIWKSRLMCQDFQTFSVSHFWILAGGHIFYIRNGKEAEHFCLQCIKFSKEKVATKRWEKFTSKLGIVLYIFCRRGFALSINCLRFSKKKQEISIWNCWCKYVSIFNLIMNESDKGLWDLGPCLFEVRTRKRSWRMRGRARLAGRGREGEGLRRECGAPRMQIAATNT